VSQVTFHPTQPFLAVQSHDRSVEIFRIRTEQEVLKKQARRRKRAKEKEKDGKAETGKDVTKNDAHPEVDQDVKLVDLFTPHLIVRGSGKIRSFAFGGNNIGPSGTFQVRVALENHNEVILNRITALSRSDDQCTRSLQCSTPIKIEGSSTRVNVAVLR
jgi:U3 small nucleolar RNA-associated protein 12